MSSPTQKAVISIFAATLFFIVSAPNTYMLTNFFNNTTSCPSDIGSLIHMIVFFGITFGSMFLNFGDKENSNISSSIKFKHSLYSALIFYLISSKPMYKLTRMFHSGIANDQGCPTYFGLLLHSLVFFAAIFTVMYLPDFCQ